MDFEKILETAILLLPGLIIGLTVHEAAHAITAKWLGDRTSEKMGRVSLNPMRHLSLYGTLALFFLHFGWGKPVIVNLYNFKKPKFYYLLSSLAGPASNLIICGISLAILHMQPHPVVFNFLIGVFLINGMLAAINLVPIPPLDGSKIWPCLIPGMKPAISGKWSMIWIVVLIVSLQTGGIGKVLGPIQDGMWSLLPDHRLNTGLIVSNELPDGYPEYLIPPENANNPQYTVADPTRYVTKFSTTFDVREGLSGTSTYRKIEANLIKFGWRKLKYNLYEPESEHVSEMRKSSESSETNDLYYCNDVWINASNDILNVYRKYISHDDPNLTSKHVFTMNFSNGQAAKSPEILYYKELHPEEFEWKSTSK